MAQGFLQASKRPPEKFRVRSYFSLWLKRFEIYVRQCEIGTGESQVRELISLLEDEPFRHLHRLTLLHSTDYTAIVEVLKQRYAPAGNKLEWQYSLQTRIQKDGEALEDYAGELHILAEKAFPKWSQDKQQEMARNQFIQGIQSATIQLALMKEQPGSLDEALSFARKQETVELAPKNQTTAILPSP